MPEQSAMEMFKYFTTAFCILFLLALGIFMLNLNQSNDYQQYASYQIEHEGGLTQSALDKINAYNESHTGGRYSIQLINSSGDPVKTPQSKQPYGTEVNYRFTGAITVYFFNIPPFTVSRTGTADTQVR